MPPRANARVAKNRYCSGSCSWKKWEWNKWWTGAVFSVMRILRWSDGVKRDECESKAISQSMFQWPWALGSDQNNVLMVPSLGPWVLGFGLFSILYLFFFSLFIGSVFILVHIVIYFESFCLFVLLYIYFPPRFLSTSCVNSRMLSSIWDLFFISGCISVIVAPLLPLSHYLNCMHLCFSQLFTSPN